MIGDCSKFKHERQIIRQLFVDKELPDYLPLMLEFAAVADHEKAAAVFQKYAANLEELRLQLSENESIYTAAFS